ncbi:MAG: polyphosphate polymerase domain-containing protein [Planctomycetia bacterium]|nr:polyphosphate polymerase domain-containing protein [Planctomycetia bacterium]
MPYRHRLQASRFELKYLVEERCARSVRDFARGYLEPDEHAKPDNPHGAYRVSSLYLDTPALTLFGQTMGGLKNRFKLRIRFYDDAPGSPAFLEVKGRETDVVRKQRAAVTRDGVRRLLDGAMLGPADLIGENGDERSAGALAHFFGLCRAIDAEGVLYVSYMREAYVSPGSDQVRLTFDRDLSGGAFDPCFGLTLPSERTGPILDGVVLELKFTDRFPSWMRDLVQTFNLERCSVAKYCACVEAMGYRPGQWRFIRQGIAR